jgi:four helix bundle protein
MKNYKDLIVWQKAMGLVKLIYEATGNFPSCEKFGLTDQLRRSAISIPSNIAEGYGRGHKKDYVRFLQIARGSLYEMETQTEIASMLNYLSKDDYSKILTLSIEIEKMLNSLISKLTDSQK